MTDSPDGRAADAPLPAPTLYLIDGHAQMFRAYHAIRGGMTSPVTGEPTNAVFAFTALLLKLFEQYRPTHVAMAIDSEGDTFRHAFYPQYKANRSAPPEDFKPQIPVMLNIARLFGIPILEVPGDEADDIMATLATRLPAEHTHLRIRLVAKDKDLEQVLSDRVTLFDAHTDDEFNVPALLAKRGITPQQVIDYQTLIGDSTDNIPGVKGIGPKTASTLLNNFGSLAELLKNMEQLKGKQKENLKAAIDAGDLDKTRRLVTLKLDSQVAFDLAASEAGPIDQVALDDKFKQLGFNRHRADLRRLMGLVDREDDAPPRAKKTPAEKGGAGGLFDQPSDGQAHAAPADPLAEIDGHYTAITTLAQLDELVETLETQPIIAIDTETIGLGHTAKLCGLCFAWTPRHGIYVPVRSPDPAAHLDEATVLATLRPILEDRDLPKVGHNIKYDWLVLHHAGVTLRGVAFDTMVAAFLCGAPGIGMDHLALSELGRTMVPITRLIGKKPRRKADPPQITMDKIALDLITAYSAEDADITLRLYELYKPRLNELGMTDLATTVEMPLVEVLATMEANGIRVDPDELERQRVELDKRAAALRIEILNAAQADFNPDSPKQLGDVLFNQLGFPVQRKTKTGYSTDAEVLDKLAALSAAELDKVPDHAKVLPGLIVEYRMLTKLVGTYFGNLTEAIAPGDHRVHASFHQTGAATGRLSSSNPNLQNIPIRTEVGREIRRAFVAEAGSVLISADYSQIELRLLAHLSEDEALIQAFRAERDIHTAVAARVFNVPLEEVTAEQRGHAKTINFGIIYGVTPFGLARRIEGLDLDGATRLIDDYKATYPGIDRFLGRCVEQALAEGYVSTILGRRRWIEQVASRNPQQRALGERLAINSVVQGSAADLIKLAMVNLHRRLIADAVPAKMLLQIHDELMIECPAAEADAVSAVVVHEMEQAMTLRVRLRVEAGIGADWFAAK